MRLSEVAGNHWKLFRVSKEPKKGQNGGHNEVHSVPPIKVLDVSCKVNLATGPIFGWSRTEGAFV